MDNLWGVPKIKKEKELCKKTTKWRWGMEGVFDLTKILIIYIRIIIFIWFMYC